MKEALHFAHGNGFPSPCYRQMLYCLEKYFSVFFIDRIGHSTEYPVTENWHYLVHEVAESIKQQADKPIIALGHSLGGVLSFRAAVEFPDLIKAVILLDSPIIGRFKSNLLRLTKALGMIDKITPASQTRDRRRHWHGRAEVLHYLRQKPLFRYFTEACLNDYVDYGMVKNEKGYSLRFDRNIEYQIYKTIPHILHQFEGKLQVPGGLIYGTESTIVDSMDIRHMKKKYGIISYPIKGTHMFPMEHPQQTAELIIKLADAIVK